MVNRPSMIVNEVYRNGGATYKWLHRFTLLTAITTFLLIFVGGLVTSHEAGLSVPDWPNTYGEFMITFPPSKWVGNILYEHGHRLMATLVGFFITVQAIWLTIIEKRKWVKTLGWVALLGVIAQGMLGGMTVLFYLPTEVSTAHASLAQTVFCLTLAIAMVTSTRWNTSVVKQLELPGLSLRTLAPVTVAVIFIQLVLGGIMRHTQGAGLAIPTFPTHFGTFIPEFSSFGIVINFTHRMWALVVTGFVITTVTIVLKKYKNIAELRRPAYLIITLLLTQLTLGALTIITHKAVTPTTLHVSCGAGLLGAMVFLTIRVRHLYKARLELTRENVKTVGIPTLSEV